MITRPTVLILGAGASYPYGLPLGGELRNSICQLARDFARQFKRSHVKSIDAFLAKRTEFTDVGKLVIAAILINKENPDKLDHVDDAEHWYAYMWNLMIPDINNVSELRNNQIRFITFNYDRSLEYFLHLAIKNTFGVNDAEAYMALSNIEIVHVYGSLGHFHYLSEAETRQYLNDLNPQSLRTAANGIEIIPEARHASKAFQRARDLCAEADNIGFLGFGFDALNIERLGLVDVLQWRDDNGEVQTGQ